MQQSLDVLRLTSDESRRAWAIRKAEALAEIKRSLVLGVASTIVSTPEQAKTDWLATMATPTTRIGREIVLRAFVAWLQASGIRRMADLRAVHLATWRDHVLSPTRSEKHAPLTRHRWLLTTGAFLRWSAQRGLVPLVSNDQIANTMRGVRVPRPEPRILKPHQVRAMLTASLAHDRDGRYRAVSGFLLALLLSGARYHELARMEWSEVDFSERCLRLAAERTKTRRARSVHWPEMPALGKLLEAMHVEGATGQVFGWPLTSFNAARDRIVELGSPRFSAHDLRRTCAALLVCSPNVYRAASIYMAAERLGHDVSILAKRYAKLLRDLPTDAATLEASAGIADLAEQIVAQQATRRLDDGRDK